MSFDWTRASCHLPASTQTTPVAAITENRFSGRFVPLSAMFLKFLPTLWKPISVILCNINYRLHTNYLMGNHSDDFIQIIQI